MYEYLLKYKFETSELINKCIDCPAYASCNDAIVDGFNTGCARLTVDVPEHLSCRIKAIIKELHVPLDQEALIYQKVLRTKNLFDLTMTEIYGVVENLK